MRSEIPTKDWNRLYAALSKMTGLQELIMVNLCLSASKFAEMRGEIGSLHQLRYITLDRSCAKLRHLVVAHTFHSKSGAELLHGSCNCRKLEVTVACSTSWRPISAASAISRA